MKDALNQLRQITLPMYPLREEEWTAFSSVWAPFSARRKEILTRAGEKEKYLYFVLEGIQRVYYEDEEDREATLVFTYAPSFGGVLDALLLQQPSKYYYETLTPSVFLRTTFQELNALMRQHAGIEQMVRQGLTVSLAGVLDRLVELQCFSAEERFRSLLKRTPSILQRIPHKYLANYIGIDATNFSKLINRVRI